MTTETQHKAKESEKDQRLASSAVGVLGRILTSTAVWILLSVFAVDYFLSAVRPLQYMTINGIVTADQEPLDEKLAELFSSTKKPDVLVFGSSLAMVGCFGSDWITAGKPAWAAISAIRYTGAHSFEKALSEEFHQPIKGFNLALHGSMISDQYIILKDTITRGVKPKLVIFEVAPRDFMDNLVPSVEGGRIKRFYEERKDGVQLSASKSLSDNSDQVFRHFWRFFKVRADYQRTIEFIVCSALGRASSVFYATEGKKFDQKGLTEITFNFNNEPYTDPTASRNINSDLIVYKQHYLPLNEDRIAQELAYLQKNLALCKENGIVAVVVNMPIRQENMKLLPSGRREALTNSIAAACRENSANFMDFTAGKNYPASDFYDSVHMRPQASKKFFEELASEIHSNVLISKQLAASLSNNLQISDSGNKHTQ